MPAITATKFDSTGSVVTAQTTLNGTDSFVYVPGVTKYLMLRNPTVGSISPVIDGDGATTEYLVGVGHVNIAGGFAVGPIAAGDAVVIDLDAIRAYLQGTIAITSGTGLVAILGSK